MRPPLAPALERRARGRQDPRPLRHNGQPYHGINVIMLWFEAMVSGYTDAERMILFPDY
nr:ArdC family protein [Thiorhodococcus minor]